MFFAGLKSTRDEALRGRAPSRAMAARTSPMAAPGTRVAPVEMAYAVNLVNRGAGAGHRGARRVQPLAGLRDHRYHRMECSCHGGYLGRAPGLGPGRR